MRLSMWILADWLKDYSPMPFITKNERTIRNIRFFTNDAKLLPSVVYTGMSQDFISTSDRRQVICVHEYDMILLDTDDVNEVYNKILDAFDYYNEWSDHLSNMIQSGSSLQELLDQAYTVLDMPMTVADPGFQNLAISGYEIYQEHRIVSSALTDHTMPIDIMLDLNKDKRLRQYNRHSYLCGPELNQIPSIVRNLFSQKDHIGWLVASPGSRYPHQSRFDLIDVMGDLVESWNNTNTTNEKLYSIADILRNVLVDRTVTARNREEFMLLGWYPNDAKCMILVRTAREATVLLHVRSRLAQFSKGCITILMDDHLVIIANLKIITGKELQNSLEKWMEKTSSHGICSSEFYEYDQLPDYYQFCCDAAELIPFHSAENGKLYFPEDIAVPYLFSTLRKAVSVDLTPSVLKTLREYDTKSGTELYRTLYSFLMHNCSYIETGKALFVHRNSVFYRINKACELTGLNLDDPQVRFYLLMSYYLCDESK